MPLDSIYKFIGNFLKTKYVYQLLVHCACHKVCSENCNWLKSWGGHGPPAPSGITPLPESNFGESFLPRGGHSCLCTSDWKVTHVAGESLVTLTPGSVVSKST